MAMRRSTIATGTPNQVERMAEGQPPYTNNHTGVILDTGVQQESFGQPDAMNNDFSAIFGVSPAVSQDTALSPEDCNDVGWDWFDFTQLFPDPV
jgi:hypothetical protein